MECDLKESRVQMALDALKKGQFKSQRAAALAFDIPETTLHQWIRGVVSRPQKKANCQKLSDTEESTLLAGFWIWTNVVYLFIYQLFTI